MKRRAAIDEFPRPLRDRVKPALSEVEGMRGSCKYASPSPHCSPVKETVPQLSVRGEAEKPCLCIWLKMQDSLPSLGMTEGMHFAVQHSLKGEDVKKPAREEIFILLHSLAAITQHSNLNFKATLTKHLWNLTLLVLVLSLPIACKREERRFSDIAPSAARYQPWRMSELQPGEPGAPATEPAAPMQPALKKGPYDESAWAVSEGKRLFQWYNCVGCHAHGGGGMGPALMDDKWIYGSEPENIYETILEGRPNGMPAFGGKIPDAQMWQLVAYVRSISGLLRKDVRPTRSDHMSVRPSEQSMKPETPTTGGTARPGVETPQ